MQKVIFPPISLIVAVVPDFVRPERKRMSDAFEDRPIPLLLQ
jgi:hypothetical protein